MLVSKRAVEEFLGRELEDFRWVKTAPRHVLEREVRAIVGLDFVVRTKPRHHQLACLLIGLCLRSFNFFLDMGAGKTKLALDIFAARRHLGEVDRLLVLVDNEVNLSTWQKEVRKHTCFSCVLLEGSTKEKWALLEDARDADVVVVHYPGFVHLVSDKVEGKRKTYMKPNAKKVLAVAQMFGMVAMDEVHMCANKDSASYKAVDKLTSAVRYGYGYTGTPTGKDPMDFWSLFHLVDKGATLGSSIGIYRAVFFRETKNFWGGSVWEFRKDMQDGLTRVLQNRSIAYGEEELGDLPPLVRVPVSVPQSPQVKSYYGMLKQGFIDMHRGKVDRLEVKNAYVRMRQCLSGFLGVTGDEEGVRLEVEFRTEKLAWLEQELPKLLETSGKVIIFHEFVRTGDLIHDTLRRMKIRHVSVHGKEKNKRRRTDRFLEDGTVTVCAGNVSILSKGWNPQEVANKMVFFELPPKLRDYRQALKRCLRAGQPRPHVYAYFLLTEGTLEETRYDDLLTGADTMRRLMHGEGV